MKNSAVTRDVGLVAKALIAGKIAGIPTETVYGLAGNAFDAKAVAQIFAAKNRPTFDPLIVHVKEALNTLGKLEQAQVIKTAQLTVEQKVDIEKLIAQFWPGPLTLILPRGSLIPDLVTSGLETVGVRMPKHTLCQELLSKLSFPLAAPSANRFGRISPVTALDVEAELSPQIEYILDGGSSQVGVESTVLRPLGPTFEILRPGGVTQESLETVLGKKLVIPEKHQPPGAQFSPGTLADHYAPATPLFLFEKNPPRSRPANQKVGFLLASEASWDLSRRENENIFSPFLFLSRDGSATEGAQNLFSKLRALDALGLDLIYAESWPANSEGIREGIGAAIQDRLVRASRNKGKPTP